VTCIERGGRGGEEKKRVLSSPLGKKKLRLGRSRKRGKKREKASNLHYFQTGGRREGPLKKFVGGNLASFGGGGEFPPPQRVGPRLFGPKKNGTSCREKKRKKKKKKAWTIPAAQVQKGRGEKRISVSKKKEQKGKGKEKIYLSFYTLKKNCRRTGSRPGGKKKKRKGKRTASVSFVPSF